MTRPLLPFVAVIPLLAACGGGSSGPSQAPPDASGEAPMHSSSDAEADAQMDAGPRGDGAPTIDAPSPQDGAPAQDSSLDAQPPPPGDGGGDGGDGGVSRIVFAAAATAGDAPQVYIMNADGSGLHAITSGSTAQPTGANDGPTFSPDGSLVLFASGRDFASAAGPTVTDPTVRMLYTMKPDGTGVKRLTSNNPGDPDQCSEHDARFSHDGQWVVFDMVCQTGLEPTLDQTFRIKADGTGQETLNVGVNCETPAYSTDDSTVVCVMANNAGDQLWTIELANNQSTSILTLPSTLGIEGAPFVTPQNGIDFATGADGITPEPTTLEAIQLSGAGKQSLFTVPALTSPANLAGTPSQFDFALSPDGQALVFVAFASPGGATTNSAYTISTATLTDGSVHALTSTFAYLATPDWH